MRTVSAIWSVALLSVFDGGANADGVSDLTSGGAKRIDMIIVASQAMAEIFLSAALGIYRTGLYLRHRPGPLRQTEK